MGSWNPRLSRRERKVVKWVIIFVLAGVALGTVEKWPFLGAVFVLVYVLGRLVPRKLRFVGWACVLAGVAVLWHFQHSATWVPWAILGVLLAFWLGRRRWPHLRGIGSGSGSAPPPPMRAPSPPPPPRPDAPMEDPDERG